MTATYLYELVKTSFGVVGIVWSTPRHICKIFLPAARSFIEKEITGHYPHSDLRARTSLLAQQIVRYFKGERIRFETDILDTSYLYEFQHRILLLEHTIPYGKVSTYGILANKAGNSRAARAVGRALAGNPFPIVIPCHRTVKTDGSLGGYQGGVEMKMKFLRLERVTFTKKKKVSPSCFV